MLYKFEIRDVNSTNTGKTGGGSSLSIGSDEKLQLWPWSVIAKTEIATKMSERVQRKSPPFNHILYVTLKFIEKTDTNLLIKYSK